jgi:hypothetical protein
VLGLELGVRGLGLGVRVGLGLGLGLGFGYTSSFVRFYHYGKD